MDNDGGPAFPVLGYSDGMRLRDWFAGMAMVQLVKDYIPDEKAAEIAFKWAEVMIAVREKKP